MRMESGWNWLRIVSDGRLLVLMVLEVLRPTTSETIK